MSESDMQVAIGWMREKLEVLALETTKMETELVALNCAATLALDVLLAGTMVGPERAQKAINALRECGVHWIAPTDGDVTDGD